MVNILQWNVRSLPARLPSIQHLVSSYNCSIILISETWLLPSRNCFIPHFNLFRQDRVDGYGGVAIAAHTSLNVSLIEIKPPLKQLLLENNIDLIGLKITNIDGLPNTSFWSCYSPNDSPIPFEVWYSLFQLTDHNSFFTGDFNAHHPAWGSTTSTRRGNLIYDALNSSNLNILNNGSPTHVGRPNSTNSCIDLSLSTPNLFWLSTWRIIDDPNGSDHLPIIISVNVTNPNSLPNNRSTLPNYLSPNLKFNLNKADWPLFSQLINSSIPLLNTYTCPLKDYEQFTHMILDISKKTIPIKRNNLNNFPPSPPWWNSSCSKAVSNRKSLYKTFIRSGSVQDYLTYRNASAATTRLLKESKRLAWKQFCTNLNPSSSIQSTWTTAKRFRNSIVTRSRPHNDSWFNDFCCKVAPCYVPSSSEALHNSILPASNTLTNHIISMPITLSELNAAIASRKSIASGPDNISPVMLKHLPTNAVEYLLNILNKILLLNKIPDSWKEFIVIPIPKANSTTAFRPIALSSALCKTMEFILKNRLDWWLEHNSILSDNLYAFRKGRGTLDCLANFSSKIYQSFNNKHFLPAAFIDIRGAFDSVHIPTLLSHLNSLQLPPIFINLVSLLFSHRTLKFTSPYGSTNIRSTYTGLPQGSCLSPILFNLYMNFIIKQLNTLGHECLVYADDLVIFSYNSNIDLAIDSLNNSLNLLQNLLSSSFFSVAPEKCKAMIFTRRRYLLSLDITINDFPIPIVQNIKYLGLTLDSKLRWAPHLQHLIKFTSLWANFLRSISNTWWGSHPSTLLIIYKAVIRSKLDYGCFLSGSASYSHWKKINNLQNSCLKSIIGALKSTPNAAVEIETACPPFNIRNRWLAGKFLLKNFSLRHSTIFNSFLDIYFSWRYVKKSLPILASTAYSLSSIRNFVTNSKILPLYEINYLALSYSPIVHTNRHFLNFTSKALKSISPIIVNNLFLDYIQNNFPNSTLIYTDGSVSPLSAGYAFFIPDLHISMSNNLPSSASSFTTECFAILEALSTISALPPSSYLIVSDSLSCLLSLSSDFFNSRPSPISIRIRQLLYELTLSDFIVEFLWVPGHSGIKGNEIADSIAKSTSSFCCPSPTLIPWTDFCPLLKYHIYNLWRNQWNGLAPNYASWYKNISPSIPSHPWFHNLKLNRKIITSFSRLRFGHTLLPSHSYKLSLNDSPLCMFHVHDPMICDISHILFHCPSLVPQRNTLFTLIHSFNVKLDTQSILSSPNVPIITSLISFINQTGLKI